MTTSAHDFFVASASVAGALIGLLFVAVSVAPERIVGPDAPEVDGVRAAAALTAFTNALTVALFALVPGVNVGATATVVAIIGLLFVLGALWRVVPAWRAERIRLGDVSFLVGLLVVFVLQLLAGLGLERRPANGGDLQTICILVIVCFLVGIARSWELVGGPSVNLSHQVGERLRARSTRHGPGEDQQ